MRIYFNREPVLNQSWGGGNRLVTALAETLMQSHDIVYQLQDNIDMIFCWDPRSNKYGEDYAKLFNYAEKNHIKILQRCGDIGTHGKPELTQAVSQSIKMSDVIIFPSLWCKDKIEYKENNYVIIKNRPDKLFYKYRRQETYINKLKTVASSWSQNEKKGFEIFKSWDKSFNADNVNFTFVGRMPENITFTKSKHISPLYNDELARELSRHDVYISASELEAGSNSVLEAVACGLPIAFHANGGSIPEYIAQYGMQYTNSYELTNVLYSIYYDYETYKKNALSYIETIDETVKEVVDVIKQM